MSSHERDIARLLYELALSFDGAVLGVALAYTAVRTVLDLRTTSNALRKVRSSPELKVCDLRTLLNDDGSSKPSDLEQKENLVIVRGRVEAKSAVDGTNWKHLKSNGLLTSLESGDKAVVIQRTQTCLYNEWKGFFGWSPDIRSIFGRPSWRKRESSSVRTVPFVLVEGGWLPRSEYVLVNMDGSRHPLPLTTVYHHLQPIDVSPYTFIQAIFGHDVPVGVLHEEKILQLGKEISTVGICSFKNGIPEIKSCKDLPYFLTEMTKDQMVVDLDYKTKLLFWSCIFLGSLSIGILGYSIVRNWKRWKESRELRLARQRNQAPGDGANSQVGADDEPTGDIPDGQLCVVCLLRRRTTAFNPCGHLVCCHRCAISVEREVAPKCPICRMTIRSSMRIYLS